MHAAKPGTLTRDDRIKGTMLRGHNTKCHRYSFIKQAAAKSRSLCTVYNASKQTYPHGIAAQQSMIIPERAWSNAELLHPTSNACLEQVNGSKDGFKIYSKPEPVYAYALWPSISMPAKHTRQTQRAHTAQLVNEDEQSSKPSEQEKGPACPPGTADQRCRTALHNHTEHAWLKCRTATTYFKFVSRIQVSNEVPARHTRQNPACPHRTTGEQGRAIEQAIRKIKRPSVPAWHSRPSHHAKASPAQGLWSRLHITASKSANDRLQ